jgi:hypothetical protein
MENNQPQEAPTQKAMGLFLQDPSLPDLYENYDFSTETDYLVGTGSSRFVIRDTDELDLPLFSGLNWAEEPDLSFEYFQKNGLIDNPQFHQVNTFAVVNRTLDLVEEELGRKVAWRDGGPLVIRPHAFEGANAYYDPMLQSLNFGYFTSPFRRTPIWTCLSHDIVSHELGHAILDTLRPFYLYSFELDPAALHESLADLLALFATLAHPTVVKVLYGETKGDMRHPSLVTRLAEEFGTGLGGVGVPYLRSALEGTPYLSAPKEPHSRSTTWTGAIYEILENLVKLAYPSEVTDTPEGFDRFCQALVEASHWVKGMLFRAFNYMPPSGVTMPMLARLIYEADARVYPDDSKFREIAKEVFIKWELWDELIDLRSPDLGADLQALSAYDAAKLTKWVMQHAEALRIPIEMGVRLLKPRFYKTVRHSDKVKQDGKSVVKEITEYYLEYVYEQGQSILDFETNEAVSLAVYGGGTLVIDDSWQPILLATNPEAYLEPPPEEATGEPIDEPLPEGAIEIWMRARHQFEHLHQNNIQRTIAARHEQRSVKDRAVVPGCPFVIQRGETGSYRLVRRCCNLQEHMKGICFSKYGMRQ